MTDPQPRPVIPIPVAPMAVLAEEPALSPAARLGRWERWRTTGFRGEPGAIDLSRLRRFVLRLSATGAILGTVVFLILFFLILYVLPDEAFGSRPISAVAFNLIPRPFLTILPAAAALAMAVLILFYCVRAILTFRTMVGRRIEELWSPDSVQGSVRRPPLPFLRSDLNKIRLMAAPLLAIFLLGLAIGLGSGRGSPTPTEALIPLGLAVGVLGCCWQLITVRRARWEVARIEGASFAATQARGFTVLPAFAEAAAVQPLPVFPIGSANAPPPMPAAAAPMVLSADAAADIEAADHADTFVDWEAVVHGIAILGILLGALSFPTHVETMQRVWERVTSNRAPMIMPVPMPPGSSVTPTPISQSFELFGVIQAVSAAIAVGWVVWGLICLCGGPRFRPLVLWLIWSGLIVSAAVFVVTLQWDEAVNPMRFYGYPPPYQPLPLITFDSIYGIGGSNREYSPLLPLVNVTLFSLIALLLVTRQPVKSVFTYRPRRVRSG